MKAINDAPTRIVVNAILDGANRDESLTNDEYDDIQERAKRRLSGLPEGAQ